MRRCLPLLALALFVFAAPARAADLTGQYVEARTCDVWTSACFANAELNLSGKHAVLAWKFDEGSADGVSLAGLSVVAVVEATDTLGIKQTGPARSVLLVDEKASPAQRAALVKIAKKLGGSLVQNVLSVEPRKIDLAVNNCKEGGCATLDAGIARIQTRCLDADHDKVCGNESEYYPPLTKGLTVRPAIVGEHSYTGKAFDKTWCDAQKRGAYVGTFKVE